MTCLSSKIVAKKGPGHPNNEKESRKTPKKPAQRGHLILDWYLVIQENSVDQGLGNLRYKERDAKFYNTPKGCEDDHPPIGPHVGKKTAKVRRLSKSGQG